MSPTSAQQQMDQVVAAAASLMVLGFMASMVSRMARGMWAPEREKMLPQTRRYGDRVAISKGFRTRDEAVEWTQKWLGYFSAEVRPHRVARVWHSQAYQAWFGAIYIKEAPPGLLPATENFEQPDHNGHRTSMLDRHFRPLRIRGKTAVPGPAVRVKKTRVDTPYHFLASGGVDVASHIVASLEALQEGTSVGGMRYHYSPGRGGVGLGQIEQVDSKHHDTVVGRSLVVVAEEDMRQQGVRRVGLLTGAYPEVWDVIWFWEKLGYRQPRHRPAGLEQEKDLTRPTSNAPGTPGLLPATVMQREEIRALDLRVSPDDYTEGLWIASREDAWALYKANYIDLSTLDRIEGALAVARYEYPPGSKIWIALLYHKDGYWTVFTRIGVPS